MKPLVRRPVTVRLATAIDSEELRPTFSRLSPETIHLRFHAPYPEVPA